MADLADVANAVNAVVTSAIYPNGTSSPPIAGDTAVIYNGWPLPTDLENMVTSFHAQVVTARTITSIYPRPGVFRNTSRYFPGWQEVSRPTATLTASIDTTSGVFITIAGSPPGATGPVQNVGAIVQYGGIKSAFVYQTTAADTLDSIAANLADLINVATPASVAGAVISVQAATTLTVRIGVIGVIGSEQRRQSVRIDINIWAPSPALRDLIAGPVREAFAQFDYLTLADGFAARCQAAADHWLDDPEKAGLYRRLLSFEVDYPTTLEVGAAEIIVFEVTGIAPYTLVYGGPAVLPTPPPPGPTPGPEPLPFYPPIPVPATAAAGSEALFELEELTVFSLPNGSATPQYITVVDNLGLASPTNPITINLTLRVGSVFVFTEPGMAVRFAWSGAYWIPT